jgi:hypothetical protein
MCQKVVNVIAVASGVVSLAVVIGGLSVYVNRDSIIDNVKSQALEAVMGGLGGGVPSVGTESLPTGSNDLMPSAPQANPTVTAPTSASL